MMSIPVIESLRAGNWAGLTYTDRIAALQQFENTLAAQENRSPCRIGEIPASERQISTNGQSLLRGQHYRDDQGYINLDPSLLQDNLPYQAVETYLHEARHDYQQHVTKHPEMHNELPSLVSDWEKNEGAYLNPEDAGFSYYRWQPVEADANQIARTRTAEIYQSELIDQNQYPAYHARKNQELSDEIFMAEQELGENYIEVARQAMLSNHAAILSLHSENKPTGQEPEEGPDYSIGYSM
jgi:hypothetical protein